MCYVLSRRETAGLPPPENITNINGELFLGYLLPGSDDEHISSMYHTPSRFSVLMIAFRHSAGDRLQHHIWRGEYHGARRRPYGFLHTHLCAPSFLYLPPATALTHPV